MNPFKFVIVVALIVSAPVLINLTTEAAETAISTAECAFNEQKMAEIRAAMPEEHDISSIEEQLSGKSCKEAIDWINSRWKTMHDEAKSFNDNI